MERIESTTTEREANWKTSRALEDSKQEIRQHLDETLEHGKELAGKRREKLAHRVSEVSSALKDTASRLDSDQNPAAEPIKKMAEGIASFSEQIQNKSLTEAVEQTKDFARRRPAIAVGACVLAGLAVAHFLKAGVSAASEKSEPVEPVAPTVPPSNVVHSPAKG